MNENNLKEICACEKYVPWGMNIALWYMGVVKPQVFIIAILCE